MGVPHDSRVGHDSPVGMTARAGTPEAGDPGALAPGSTVAFVGLGVMGSAMAVNLVRAGFDVIGYNRTPGKTAALAAHGVRAADSVADAVREASAVFTMLPAFADVEQVALADGGIVANARPGTLYIDTSSIKPESARRLAAAGAQRELRVLDAPVSGGEQGAKNASLAIMVGGDTDDVAAAAPLLTAVGRTVVHVGPAGSGQLVKLANQLVVGGVLQTVSEALVLLEASAVNLPEALRVLRGGLAGSAVLDVKADAMHARRLEPGGRIALHLKDMHSVLDAARQVGVAVPAAAVVAELMAVLPAQGRGGLDHGALVAVIAELSGR